MNEEQANEAKKLWEELAVAEAAMKAADVAAGDAQDIRAKVEDAYAIVVKLVTSPLVPLCIGVKAGVASTYVFALLMAAEEEAAKQTTEYVYARDEVHRIDDKIAELGCTDNLRESD